MNVLPITDFGCPMWFTTGAVREGGSPMIISKCLRLCIAVMSVAVPLSTCELAAAHQERVLYTFTGQNDGGRPMGTLTFDPARNLYGTTTNGGTYGGGVAFRLSASGSLWSYSVLYSFGAGSDGLAPTGKLIFDAAGNLYGTTSAGGSQGCGTVFELSPSSSGTWSEMILYQFTCGADGGNPQAGVVFDKAGNLYGTTFIGGAPGACASVGGCGTVFKLAGSRGTWDFTVLHAFQDADGGNPQSGVSIDPANNLFGTTLGFGALGWGTAYELLPDAQGQQTRFRLLHTFGLRTDGGNPAGGIVFDSVGNAYGSTMVGGHDGAGYGTIYRLERNRDDYRNFRTLYTFLGEYSGGVQQNVLIAPNGVLYGAGGVGLPGWGGIFKLAHVLGTPNWTYSPVYTFADVNNGAFPGGLVRDINGNFFGTTNEGGAYNNGVIFEVVP